MPLISMELLPEIRTQSIHTYKQLPISRNFGMHTEVFALQ